MKRIYVVVASLMLLCFSAYALKSGAFSSLEHISSCENLLIIHVPMTSQASPPSHDSHGATLAYTVQVLRDLRGDHPVGAKMNMSVLQKLTPGSRYLLSGKPATRGGKPWLLFHWQLGVVEIPSTFKLVTLDGKDIPTQITALLGARRAVIAKQLKDLNRENELLDKVIAKEAPNKTN
jgi:hypothetical protein